MLTHRGFSAWIVADGKNLPEYLVAVDEKAHRVSCWIPSKEGQAFTVYWKDHGGKVDTCAFITLDGFVVPGRFLFGEGVTCRQGVRTSKTTERPFMFQEVNDNGGESSSQAAKDVGMVSLRIKRVDRVSSRPANALQAIPETILGKRKPGELCVGFGEEKHSYEQYATTWSVKPHDQDALGAKTPSTYVTFVFRYRSHEFLETQGILTDVEKESAPAKRIPVRRVVSLPPPIPMPMTPTPSPPNKKPKPLPAAVRVGSHRLRGPSLELRRTVSWKVISTKREGFPGEGLIQFEDAKQPLQPQNNSRSFDAGICREGQQQTHIHEHC